MRQLRAKTKVIALVAVVLNVAVLNGAVIILLLRKETLCTAILPVEDRSQDYYLGCRTGVVSGGRGRRR